MKGKLHSIGVAGVLLALVATLVCGSSARAGDGAKGRFVLPFEVQWQGKTLPAGEYHFTLRSGNVTDVLFLRDAQNHRNIVMVEARAQLDFPYAQGIRTQARNTCLAPS